MNDREQRVKEALEENGWTVYRHGWPDFLCIRDKRLVGVEVKAGGNDYPTARQEKIHSALRTKGIDCHVVRVSLYYEFVELPPDMAGFSPLRRFQVGEGD